MSLLSLEVGNRVILLLENVTKGSFQKKGAHRFIPRPAMPSLPLSASGSGRCLKDQWEGDRKVPDAPHGFSMVRLYFCAPFIGHPTASA